MRRLFEAVVPNQAKCALPTCVQKPFAALWRAPGIVDRDPGGAREPGAQHLAVLRQEAVLAGYQQTHELPLGDDDAERPQLRQQPRHRHLALMVLGQHEAAQLRPEMPADAGRQRCCHHVAVRLLPALAAEIHDVRADHQVLHHKIRVALEARALRRGCDCDGPLLVDRKLRSLAALLPRLAPSRRWRPRLGRLVHATGFDIRPARSAFEPGNLVALRRNCPPQLGHLFEELQHQALQIGVR